ncbi:TRAP transporter small permease [Rhizobium sp. CG4]|jgi:TRAP-type C4-dicarboxylate transport system permease small subunit|uniref:TRAP transporter small permease n=1 Tax=Rhizobium/Agrobacterium group TaxID=227290 RepID=UPI002033B1FE|nr:MULTISPECIES: TRAP transporter small permease [Rhizobium/Agrobacterium group]MCM2457853.1 TRAP transporter small permease [Rhizobium sp. CG4]MCS4243328.1 TRAP-type C4-dicarboxylate transport system permease small subunit [Rhizobium sp. BIGb0125]MDO5897686.1 TRAP transporter small permease [Agrobacterium sp. Azo12]
MHVMNRLAGLVSKFEVTVSMVAFATMVLVISANVIIRFTTGNSLVFTEEIAYIAFGYSVFFGLSLLFRMRAMIAVDLVVDMFAPGPKHIAHIISYIIMVVICGYFFYLAATLAMSGWIRRTAFLEIPYFWINLAPAISFGLMTFYSIRFLVMLLRGQELPSVDLEEQM